MDRTHTALLDDQGERQMDLDIALERIHENARVALNALKLAAAAKDADERTDYLLVALDAFKDILHAKEAARIASGDMAVARRRLLGYNEAAA